MACEALVLSFIDKPFHTTITQAMGKEQGHKDDGEGGP